jgi:ABC-type glycerol-3-phosphate transport system permease component
VLLLSACMILPVVLILVISVSSEKSIVEKGYSFLPSEWSAGAYLYIFKKLHAHFMVLYLYLHIFKYSHRLRMVVRTRKV